jgi:hypothetical protein
MPNTTRWYEIAGNFSPHLTRICFLDNFHSFATLTCEIVVETNTRIMRSKISGNFVPSRCITNDNLEKELPMLPQIASPLVQVNVKK